MKVKNNKPASTIDIMKSIRGSWGTINPCTRVIPDKKRNGKKYACRKKDYQNQDY